MNTYATIEIPNSNFNIESVTNFSKTIKYHSNIQKDIVIDFKNVIFMDSSGIGVLIEIYNTLKKYRKNLYLINTNETINKIFDITRLNTFFKIYKNNDELDRLYSTSKAS